MKVGRIRALIVALATALLALPLADAVRADPLLELCTNAAQSEPEPDWASRLPDEQPTTVTVQDVEVPSRDGTLIAARTYRPNAFHGRLPAVLVFSPYHSLLGLYLKEGEDLDVIDHADCITPFLLARGYAVVLGDMRGTHDTEGCFDYGGPDDRDDGYALVQWIAGQRWSNGKVGMYGVSHVGMSQYGTAVASPPALKAIIPIAPVTSFYRYLYGGGVRYETNMGTPPAYELGAAGPPPTDVENPNWAADVASTSCSGPNLLRGASTDGDMSAYFKARDYPSLAGRIRAAVFHVHGTLDENVKVDHFTAMWRALERHDVTRKALIGPWKHAEPNVPHWRLWALRWYEHWLHRNDTGMMEEPTLSLIDRTGVARTATSFPPADRKVMRLQATSGQLRSVAPAASASYTDVPGLPRPGIRAAVGARLIYTSPPLRRAVRLSGTPIFDVVASIDRTDTNFAVHLFEVVDGQPRYVTRGYLDARHRASFGRGEDVVPGRAERYRVALHGREYVFAAGHHIEVVLSSSDSCQWLVEVQGVEAGCSSSGVVSDPVPARVTVYEATGATQLRLPVAPMVPWPRLMPSLV